MSRTPPICSGPHQAGRHLSRSRKAFGFNQVLPRTGVEPLLPAGCVQNLTVRFGRVDRTSSLAVESFAVRQAVLTHPQQLTTASGVVLRQPRKSMG